MQLKHIDWNKGAASAMISIFIIILGVIMYLACFDNLMTYNMSARLQAMTDTLANSVAAYTVTISEQDADTTSGQSGIAGSQRTNYFNYKQGQSFADAYQKVANEAVDVFILEKCETNDGGTIESSNWSMLINGKTAYSSFGIGIHADADDGISKATMLGVGHATRERAFLSKKAYVHANALVESTTYIVEANNDKISFPDDITEPCIFYQNMADMPKDWETYNGILNQFKLQSLPRYDEDEGITDSINKSSYFIKDFLQAYGINIPETFMYNETELKSGNSLQRYIEKHKQQIQQVSMEAALNWVAQGYPAFIYIDSYGGTINASDKTGEITENKVYFANQYLLLRTAGKSNGDYIDVAYVYHRIKLNELSNPADATYLDYSSPFNQNRDRLKIPKAFFTDIGNKATFYIVKE